MTIPRIPYEDWQKGKKGVGCPAMPQCIDKLKGMS